MSVVPQVPQLEIYVFKAHDFVLVWIKRDVGVTVRSVHFMQSPNSVENLVLNSSNDLLLSSSCETLCSQYDGLGSSNSAILAPAIVPRAIAIPYGIFGGETE